MQAPRRSLWQPTEIHTRDTPMPFTCRCCLQSCELIDVDFGVGVTEAWGVRANDVRIERVSRCCEADYGEDRETIIDPLANEPIPYVPQVPSVCIRDWLAQN
jgi:hypothetical protein